MVRRLLDGCLCLGMCVVPGTEAVRRVSVCDTQLVFDVCGFSRQTPAVAEMNFLVTAAQLDTYGVDPHPVKVQRSSLLTRRCHGHS